MPTTITIARNTRSSLYEFHAADCRHLTARHLEPMTTQEVPDVKDAVAEAAALYEAQNEGCLTKLGPCVRETD